MNRKPTFLLLLLAVVWGGYYVATQKSVEFMSVFAVGIVIRFVTMVFLTGIMATKKQLRLLGEVKGVLGRLLLIGLMGFLLDLTAFVGLTLSPAGSGTALMKCDILFVNIISVWIYKYRFSKADWLYTLVMLLGVLLVMDINPLRFSFGGAGDIFFILSALFVSINAFLIKSVQTDPKNPVSDNVVAYYNNFVTMVFFAGFALFNGDILQLGRIRGNRFLLIALLCAALGQTLVYQLYYYNLRRFPVWIVKVFLLLMPVASALIGFLLFGDRMSALQYGGMVVVLAGAYGVVMEQKKKAAAPT